MIATKDLTARDLYNMPSDEQAKRMTDPEFRAKVDELAAQPVRRPVEIPSPTSARDREQLAARKAEGFDPSFDTEPPAAAVAAVEPIVEPAIEAVQPAVAAPVVTPVVPAVAPVVAELPEKIHEYQPVDAQGRNVGGVQRFKYRTDAELIEKLTAAHKAASAKIRELVEEKLLSSTEIPENATPAQDLGERPVLTDEERKALEEKLQDSVTEPQARYQLDRDDERRITNGLLRKNFENSILLAIEGFKNRNRDYVHSQENAVKLVGFIERRGLDPTDTRNYQKAYDILRENGSIITPSVTNQPTAPALVTEAPSVREEKTVPKTQAPVEATARISQEVPPQATRPVAQISTGLSNNDVTSEGEPIAKPHWLTTKKWLKDREGKPTSQFVEYHDIEAVESLEGKAEKEFHISQTPQAKALRAKYEEALAERAARLAENQRKRGW